MAREIESASIEFKDVSFGYGTGEKVLDRMSFQIEPGRLTAIVGKSGSGKSSLLKLITRLYDAAGGAVLVDGVDVKSYTQESLRSQIAVVPQHPFVFTGTVSENIALSDTNTTIHAISAASELAGALGFIEGLEKGFDTRLGQGGAALSGGQIKQIAVARAILRNPKILLLDEPSSGLDDEAEAALLSSLESLKHRVSVVIAGHSPRAIKNADKVLVIENGRVQREGGSKELLSSVDLNQIDKTDTDVKNEKLSIGD